MDTIFIPSTSGMTKQAIVDWLNDELDMWGVERSIEPPQISNAICQEFVDKEHEIRSDAEHEEDRVDDTSELILDIITKIGGAKLVDEVRENRGH